MEVVRQLVLKHGWNATAYQILNPGIEHWLSPSHAGVVGFVREPKRWITAGAPVCEDGQLLPMAEQFEASAAERDGSGVCYFYAMNRFRDRLVDDGRHASIAIGAQPVWDPRAWPDIVAHRRSLRGQLHRAWNKGVRILQPSAERSRDDAELQRCLEEWLSRRPMPPMHFLTEPDTLHGVLADRLLYVAVRDGGPVGFLLASPVPLRRGYLIEQVIRGERAPNGTAELLIDAAMHDLGSRGCTYATLGLVALSRHAHQEIRDNPLWLRALMAWARAHGRRFYNFEGLERFRAKMEPQRWEPVHAVTNEPHFSLTTLHAIAQAFCNGSPAAAVARAVAKAIGQEATWFARRWKLARGSG